MGFADRAIRVVIALVIATLFFTNVITGIWGIVLLALAAIMLVTSLVSFCPVYLPFGLNTLRKKAASGKQPNK